MTFVHRTRRLALAAGLLVAALGLVGPVLAANIGVSIADKSYAPAEIVVAVGSTVTWTVTKSIGEPHSVTSGKPTDAERGKVFDSGVEGLEEDGQAFTFTFAAAGTYDYYCVVHPVEMTGQVVVLAEGESPGETHDGIPVERRLIGAGILVLTLSVLFGAAIAWRRLNPA